MVFFAFITTIFLISYTRTIKKTGLLPLLIFLVAGISLVLFYLEHIISGLPLFYSDEINYMYASTSGAQFRLDRSLWIYLNNFMFNYDISFNGFMLKLVNIPIAGVLLLSLWNIFKNRKIFLLPIVLPYFSFIATKNFRDILILFLSVLCISMFYKRKTRYLLSSLLILGLLFLLRPFAATVIVTIIVMQMCYLTGKKIIKFKINKLYVKKIILLSVIIGSLFITPFIAPFIKRVLTNNINYFVYTVIGEGVERRAESRVQSDPRYASGNRARDFIVASFRYTVTPIPTSLVNRAIEGGSEWGVIDDLIRILHQLGYYILIGYLIINARYIPKIFSEMTQARRVVILSLLSYWPIYSLYLYGVGHQRLKLPFQIAIFLIVLLINEYKNIKKSLVTKSHL